MNELRGVMVYMNELRGVHDLNVLIMPTANSQAVDA